MTWTVPLADRADRGTDIAVLSRRNSGESPAGARDGWSCASDTRAQATARLAGTSDSTVVGAVRIEWEGGTPEAARGGASGRYLTEGDRDV